MKFQKKGILMDRDMADGDRIYHIGLYLIKFQIAFIPLEILLYVLIFHDLLTRLLEMQISYSFSYAFMREFSPYLQRILICRLPPNPHLKITEYMLSLLFALITFLIVHLTVNENIYALFILIVLIIFCGYIISLVFKKEALPRKKQNKYPNKKSDN
jgi:hypothetical protein